MSAPADFDPRVDQSAVTDESLLAAHEKLLGKQPDEKGHYRLLPLNLLFVMSALIMFGGTYLGRYAGYFDPRVYNEYALPPKQSGKEEAVPVDQVALGRAVYGQVCVACHMPNGQGQAPVFPPLAGSEWLVSEERAIRIVLHGLTGPIKVKGVEFTQTMPATGPGSPFNLNPEKVAAVLTFVRQEWGNTLPPVSVEKVVEIRGKEGNHAPWTGPELEKLP